MIGEISSNNNSTKIRKIGGARKLKRAPYTLLFDYMLIMAMLCNYFEPVTIWYGTFLTFFGVMIIAQFKYLKAITKHSIILIIGIVLLSASIISSKTNDFLLTNLLNLITPTLVCLALSAIAITKQIVFKEFLLSRARILNAWWIINIVVLVIQVSGIPLLIKKEWISRSPAYYDLCCGLFGYNRTHELLFFSCMILVCNVSLYTKKKRKSILIYTIITEAIMLICSYFNDNTALFIVLPVALLLYVFINDMKHDTGIIKKILKYLKYVFIVVIIVVILFQIPAVQKVYKDYILVRINAMLFYRRLGVAGSNERGAIVEYAIAQKTTWTVGSGIGDELLGEHFNHGFRHYGLSSMGIVMCILGIWYYVCHSCILSLCLNDLVMLKEKRKRIVTFFVAFVFIIGMSFYSPIMTSVASVFWIATMFAYM